MIGFNISLCIVLPSPVKWQAAPMVAKRQRLPP
jgi:hypothetical protein